VVKQETTSIPANKNKPVSGASFVSPKSSGTAKPSVAPEKPKVEIKAKSNVPKSVTTNPVVTQASSQSSTQPTKVEVKRLGATNDVMPILKKNVDKNIELRQPEIVQKNTAMRVEAPKDKNYERITYYGYDDTKERDANGNRIYNKFERDIKVPIQNGVRNFGKLIDDYMVCDDKDVCYATKSAKSNEAAALDLTIELLNNGYEATNERLGSDFTRQDWDNAYKAYTERFPKSISNNMFYKYE